MSFVNVYQFVCECASIPFGFEDELCDSTVLILDHSLSVYLYNRKAYATSEYIHLYKGYNKRESDC